MKRIFFSGVLWCFALGALGGLGAADITIAFDDEPEWPWTSVKGDGLDQTLVKLAAEKAKVTIAFQKLPRKRAMEQLKNGEIDGIINLSFKPERLEFLAYPMKGEKADAARRLHNDTTLIFVKTGDAMTWDGKAFQGVTGAVGALPGHGSADAVKKLGLKVDDSAKTILAQLTKIQEGRLQCAVLPGDDGKMTLAKNPDLAKNVSPLATAFSEKPGYLCFSKVYATKSAPTTEAMWTAVAEIRESQEFQKTVQDFVNKGE